ncbi:hypothetical protein SAMN05518672_110219 [Chitinophaga sp. CF118]|uniref:hypothetical protein n=1 Tax=Chitinophaga sp. CF118 TaxID=1884367 RepID=UPI0008E25842|nr:hypothetical protein [Chitinophaga sp. CF118]SFE82382.1 hypothetical protein SAMN05518672_110219 [Chitinophaga sp. CF118]
MQKHDLTLRCAIVFAIALLFSDCNKPDQDYPQYCQIVQLTNKGNSHSSDYTARFEYDAKGIPLRITRSNAAHSTPNYLFRHDKHNRVSDIIGSYGNGAYGYYFETWHRLKYDAKNRIILDSLFFSGIIDNNPKEMPGVLFQQSVITTKYDDKNRMLKYHELLNGGGFLDRYFHYNNKGNLDSIVTRWDDGHEYIIRYSKYDDMVNIHRTNPLWQYLDWDYSTNNRLPTLTSNKYGLPTTIAINSIKDDTPYFLTYGIGNMDIQYSCK